MEGESSRVGERMSVKKMSVGVLKCRGKRKGIVQRFLGERLCVLPNKEKCVVRWCFGVSLGAQMIGEYEEIIEFFPR